MKPAMTAFNAVASAWLIPASMLAYIRNDVPSGSSLLVLAGVTFAYAYRSLSGGKLERHG
jgi:hypothetical protein